MACRVLIIDDHAAVRRGLKQILSDAIAAIDFAEAVDGHQAMTEVRAARCDIAILDLNLPVNAGGAGLELIRLLKDEQPDIGILVYTGHHEEQFGMRAMRAGADGYVSKDRPPEEVPKAVTAILRGGRYVSPELAAILFASVREDAPDSRQLLSDRELQVLRLLAAGQGPAEIAFDLHVSAKTVTTYRARVLEKLKLRTNADLVRYAIENQLID
jgi:DNA-binding NarL/FixJ family response regulator